MSRSIGRTVPGLPFLPHATKLTFAPFSSSSSDGHGRGRGRGGGGGGGPFGFTSRVPGQEDSSSSKQESADSRAATSGLGHGRGNPMPSSPLLPSFSAFTASVNPPSAGRGRGAGSPPIQPPPKLERKKPVISSEDDAAADRGAWDGERNLPESLISAVSGVGRGKPMKQPVPEAEPKLENRHLRARQERAGRGRGGGRMGARGGPGGEDGGGGRGRGDFRERGGLRRRGRGKYRTGKSGGGGNDQDTADGDAGWDLGNDADGEKLAERLGPEIMNKVAEGFEEMSSRVLPSPLQERCIEEVKWNLMLECEPEYYIGDLERNPDIDEKPPPPLRDVLQKMKPFLMEYEDLRNQEEWEEFVELAELSVPAMKEIVDTYAGPDWLTAKKQQEKLDRIAKKLPQSAPDSLKQFTDRAFLSLQSNPGWRFDKKCQFMKSLVKDFSEHCK